MWTVQLLEAEAGLTTSRANWSAMVGLEIKWRRVRWSDNFPVIEEFSMQYV